MLSLIHQTIKQMASIKGIEAKNLKPGMVMAFTYAKIVSSPINLNGGHYLDLAIKTKKGGVESRTWNHNRIIKIIA